MRVQWRNVVAAVTLGFVLFLIQPGQAHVDDATVDPLPYSLSYTITGNYVVGTIDFEVTNTSSETGFQRTGVINGVINMTGVPVDAVIVAAWLYWETISASGDEIAGAQLRDQDVTLVRGVDQPLIGDFTSCSSNGSNTLTMMRADVLHLLPLELDLDGNPTGRRLVNDDDLIDAGLPLTTVTLPVRENENQSPQSAGASLLVVYRDPDPAEPLRRIVVFDGNYTHAPGEATVQRIRGFLQSSATSSSGDAQVTYLGASLGLDDTEALIFNPPPGPLMVTNPFGGGSMPRTWSSSTLNVGPLMPAAISLDDPAFGQQVTTTLTHGSDSTYDCPSEAAIIFSTTVVDVDDDGILDILEDPLPFGENVLTDPNGQEYPDLFAMGARVDVGGVPQRDFFVEITAMKTVDDPMTPEVEETAYGSVDAPFKPGGPETVFAPPHDHMPSVEVLRLVGKALGRAGIVPHFDVGPVLGAAYDFVLAGC